MSAEQLLAFHDRERRVRRRLSVDNLVVRADAYSKIAYAWLQKAQDSRLSQRDHALTEVLRIAEDDAHFVGLKIQSALESQLRREEGDFSCFYGDPKELANLVLALIERSEQAWRTIATATEQETPVALAHQLAELRELVKAQFPDASSSRSPASAIRPRLEAPSLSVASLEARISVMEAKIDGLTGAMRGFQKQVRAQPRRKR